MVITKFEIENFKSFLTRQSLPLAPITLLYGPNGGGKSSVIQAMLALRQTFNEGQGEFVTDGRDVKLGGFKAAVSRHELDREIALAISRATRIFNATDVDVTTEFRYKRDEDASHLASLSELHVAWGGEFPNNCRLKSSPCDHVPKMHPSQYRAFMETLRANKGRQTFSPVGARLFRFADGLLPLLTLHPKMQTENGMNRARSWLAGEGANYVSMHFVALDELGLPGTIRDTINGSWDPFRDAIPGRMGMKENMPAELELIGAAWSQLVDEDAPLLADFVHIEPLRQMPERIYYRSGFARPSNTDRYKTVEGWTDLLQDAPGFDEIVNAVLARFGIHYTMRVKNLDLEGSQGFYQVLLDDTSTNATVTLADAGFGMSQLLPILTHGFLPMSQAKMVAVQQPELHLHPRLQAHLADFFIETCCRENNRDLPISPNASG